MKKDKKPEAWVLPPVHSQKIDRGVVRLMRDGEPSWTQLVRYEGDQTMRCEKWVSCCGCNLKHLVTYSVFKDRRGGWYLQTRTWADHETEPKYVEQADGLKIRRKP